MLRDVIYRNMHPERVTDETRMLKEASHDDTSIAHDDISPYHRFNCECYLCTGKIKRMEDESAKAIESDDVIQVMADDQVIATYCGSCGGHRQHTDDCEIWYDDED